MAASRVVLAAAAFLSFSASNAIPGSAVIGVAMNSCAEFASHYKTDPYQVEVTFFSWAQGYMSAVNVGRIIDKKYSVNLAPNEFGIESQLGFIRDYCNNNPLDDYFIAVRSLYQKLIDIHGEAD